MSVNLPPAAEHLPVNLAPGSYALDLAIPLDYEGELTVRVQGF